MMPKITTSKNGFSAKKLIIALMILSCLFTIAAFAESSETASESAQLARLWGMIQTTLIY
jgi:lipopolysaccharide export LptBFGC system permease protein LptF